MTIVRSSHVPLTLSQAGVFTQDVYEFAESINRTAIGPYHQTVGFSGGYFLVRLCLLAALHAC